MKNFIHYILFITFLILTFVLGEVFSLRLNHEKILSKKVIISPIDKNFIEQNEVLKLLNFKDTLLGNIDITKLEKKLKNNKFIANAQVYKDLNNNVFAYIEQYKPIARVISSTSYYIDKDGIKRPLSNHYTENVILVFGNLDKNKQKQVYQLLKKIINDNILKELITEVHIDNYGNYKLRLKNFSPTISFGNNKNIGEKFIKLKAIYSYLTKYKLFKKYKKINLEYNNQVVCKK